MAVKAITFDAYGTLVRNDALMMIPRRIVTDHGLSARDDEVLDAWMDLYFEGTQQSPFRTLRTIQAQAFDSLLRCFRVDGDAAPYVDSATASRRPGARLRDPRPDRGVQAPVG